MSRCPPARGRRPGSRWSWRELCNRLGTQRGETVSARPHNNRQRPQLQRPISICWDTVTSRWVVLFMRQRDMGYRWWMISLKPLVKCFTVWKNRGKRHDCGSDSKQKQIIECVSRAQMWSDSHHDWPQRRRCAHRPWRDACAIFCQDTPIDPWNYSLE